MPHFSSMFVVVHKTSGDDCVFKCNGAIKASKNTGYLSNKECLWRQGSVDSFLSTCHTIRPCPADDLTFKLYIFLVNTEATAVQKDHWEDEDMLGSLKHRQLRKRGPVRYVGELICIAIALVIVWWFLHRNICSLFVHQNRLILDCNNKKEHTHTSEQEANRQLLFI